MAEWDPDRERYEPERDFRRDYVDAGLGDRRSCTRRREDARGVWTIGGEPRGGAPTAPSSSMGPRAATVPRGPHAGKGPKNWRTDERIRSEVCERLADHPALDASDIEVTVQSGEVTLAGTVESRQAKRLAEDITAACRAVRDVHNRLQIAPGSPDRGV